MADGELRSTNGVPLFVARRGASSARTVRLNPSLRIGCYDPSGRTVAALRTNGIQCEFITSPARLPSDLKVLLLGENAWDDTLRAAAESLRRFVRTGGRVLCLAQDATRFDGDWLPVAVEFLTSSPNDPHYPPLTRPFREQMNVNPERPWHPVFAGLDRRRLRLWSDYTGWDQTQPGFPRVYPVTAGFKLRHPAALEHTAILADYDRGLEGVALAEMFDGAGSVLLCGFDLVRRAGLDPVADRLLVNLVAYAGASGGHEVHPLVEAPIRWADFPSERGTVCGSLNGLLPNTEWIPGTGRTAFAAVTRKHRRLEHAARRPVRPARPAAVRCIRLLHGVQLAIAHRRLGPRQRLLLGAGSSGSAFCGYDSAQPSLCGRHTDGVGQ